MHSFCLAAFDYLHTFTASIKFDKNYTGFHTSQYHAADKHNVKSGDCKRKYFYRMRRNTYSVS